MIMSNASQKQRKHREPWRNNERHYCEVCNAWMGSDRQSIALHENGRKHKENVEKALAKQRDQRLAQDKAAINVQKALAQMNQAATSSHLQDVSKYGVSALHSLANATPQTVKSEVPTSNGNRKKSQKNEKAAWEARKAKREREGKEDDDVSEDEHKEKRARRTLAPDEGNYTIDGKTYLEAVTFIELLEEQMPIEVWIGPPNASLAETRLLEKQHLWRNGVLLNIRRSSKEESGKILDVAYIKDAKDEEETLEKSVILSRVRLILGSDDSIPDSLEEARIAATGGEVVKTEQVKLEIDESTGLSTWGTVEVRKTTVRQEVKEERERAREKRRKEAARTEEERLRAEGRRMEEARVENAEDSALGAYDVWNAGKAGYKGVNINAVEKMSAADARGTSLSGGKKVEFKKKAGFKKKGAKKQNRRTTSADDL